MPARPQFVQLIKDYVAKQPDYKQTLAQLKSDVVSVGATEEEYHEALKELGISSSVADVVTTTPVSAQKEKTKNPFLAKLVEADIAAHGITTLLLLILVGFYFFSPNAVSFISTIQNLLTKPQANSAASIVKQVENNTTLTPKVYASMTEVSGEKIFSINPDTITLVISGKPKRTVYGFFPYWMLDTHEKISLNGLTHVALFGLEVNDKGGLVVTKQDGDPDGGWAMWNDPKLNTLITNLKKKGIHIDLTLKAFDNTNIEKLVGSDAAQKAFIANAIYLLQLKSLNGINIDFEYVGVPDERTRVGFTHLMTNLRAEMKRQLPKSTLTVDSYVTSASIPQLIDVTQVAEQIDSFIVMGYDVHTPKGDPGPVAPIDGPSGITGFMQSYLEKISPDKLILAVPYYGYDWSVQPRKSEDSKTLPYAQIAEISKKYKIFWDDVAQAPYYSYKDSDTHATRQVHFENAQSLGIKYDYINKKDLRGVGIWALGYDGRYTDLQAVLIDKFAK